MARDSDRNIWDGERESQVSGNGLQHGKTHYIDRPSSVVGRGLALESIHLDPVHPCAHGHIDVVNMRFSSPKIDSE